MGHSSSRRHAHTGAILQRLTLQQLALHGAGIIPGLSSSSSLCEHAQPPLLRHLQQASTYLATASMKSQC